MKVVAIDLIPWGWNLMKMVQCGNCYNLGEGERVHERHTPEKDARCA